MAKEDKQNYIAALGPAIQQLLDQGVQIVSWGTSDPSVFKRAEYDYFAVWTFPDVASAQQFEAMVTGAGWHNYFDQVNAMGKAASPQEVLGAMIEL